jgi:hypothetical protein
MPATASVKALSWIAVIVLAVIAAVTFRHQVFLFNVNGQQLMVMVDRWTGRVELAPVAAATPDRVSF